MPADVGTKDDILYTWTEQATWGSGAETAHTRLDMEPEEPDDPLNEKRPNRSQRYHMTHYDNVRHDYAGAEPPVVIAMPVKRLEMAKVLFLATQKVSEAPTTPFTKTYDYGVQPDFTTGAGYIFRFQRRNIIPANVRSLSILDCIARKVSLSWHESNNDGRLFANMQCVGRGAPDRNATAGGTIVEVAETFFDFNNIKTFTANGQVLHPFAINLDFNLVGKKVSVEQATGKFLTHAITRLEIEATFDVLWSTLAHDILLDNDDDPLTTRTWILEHGTAGQVDHLKFDLNMVVRKGSKEVYENDIRLIRFRCGTLVGSQSSDTAVPFTITHSDGIDRAW